MGETSEDWKRGWNACLRGDVLHLHVGMNREFTEGYLACMEARVSGTVVCRYERSKD